MRTARGGRVRRAWPALLCLSIPACTLPEPEDGSCDAWADPHCEHPIDRLLVPKLREIGLAPREAEAEEFCRRLHVDLWGRIPDPYELGDCVLLPDAASRVDAAMASPLYERTMRRAWGETLHYDNVLGWTEAVVDLDAAVGRMYAGDLRYDDFTIEAAVHPAFLGLHPYDEWPAALFEVFLGRPARQDEIAAFEPLRTPMSERYFCEGHIYWNVYQELLDEGYTAAEAETYTADACSDFSRIDWSVNFCYCDSEENPGGCASDVLGTPISLEGRCANPDDPDAIANLVRIDAALPGDDDTCPDGVRRPECRDREILEEETVELVELAPLPLIDEAGRAELAKIGRAIAARDDFYEAAVDREARLLLGWWQTSFRRPATDLPELRRLLADLLRENGSLREIQRLLLTSQLYVAPAALPDGAADTLPDWAMAPTKLMAAETWIDSAATAVGETTGVCDFRFVTREGYYDTSILDEELAEPTPRSFFDQHYEEEAYYEFAIRLGGCSADQRRPSLSSVGIAFTESELSRTLCAYGRGVVPPDWDGSLESGAHHVIASTLGRPLDESEAALLVSDMEACIAAGADVGCADAETALRWLCRRAIESAEFATY
jgi:hypothetical protein